MQLIMESLDLYFHGVVCGYFHQFLILFISPRDHDLCSHCVCLQRELDVCRILVMYVIMTRWIVWQIMQNLEKVRAIVNDIVPLGCVVEGSPSRAIAATLLVDRIAMH